MFFTTQLPSCRTPLLAFVDNIVLRAQHKSLFVDSQTLMDQLLSIFIEILKRQRKYFCQACLTLSLLLRVRQPPLVSRHRCCGLFSFPAAMGLLAEKNAHQYLARLLRRKPHKCVRIPYHPNVNCTRVGHQWPASFLFSALPTKYSTRIRMKREIA